MCGSCILIKEKYKKQKKNLERVIFIYEDFDSIFEILK